ncbi:hypothetical protein [Photobacterium sp. DNB22_13_2]
MESIFGNACGIKAEYCDIRSIELATVSLFSTPDSLLFFNSWTAFENCELAFSNSIRAVNIFKEETLSNKLEISIAANTPENVSGRTTREINLNFIEKRLSSPITSP